jgi:hypothetical protein
MQIKQSSSVFSYASPYWTDDLTLNAQYTTPTTGIDVKLPAFSSVALTGIRICVEILTHCYDYQIGTEYTSAKALFSGAFIRTTDMGQEAFEDLFDSARAGTTSNYHYQRANHRTCLQRPGFNTECSDSNKARFGFCGNVPSQTCQSADSADSDFAIGIGCNGQNSPFSWGAGFNNYYAYDVVSPAGEQTFQAWLYAMHSTAPAGWATTYTTNEGAAGRR